MTKRLVPGIIGCLQALEAIKVATGSNGMVDIRTCSIRDAFNRLHLLSVLVPLMIS